MILWFFLLVAAVLASEAMVRLPLVAQIRRVAAAARKSAKVVRSAEISDHWKERILPAYSWAIGKGSVVFFAMLCLALAPVALLGLIFPGGMAAWGAALLQPAAIAGLFVMSAAYLWLRQRAPRG